MFVIRNTVTGEKHLEPSRRSWQGTEYKTKGAAKAGIARTLKYYANAIAHVEQTVANGLPAYHSKWYDTYREATDPNAFRTDFTHINDPETYEVMSVEDYGNPTVTVTGKRPYDGKEITVTLDINDVGVPHLDPRMESYWSM